MTLTELRYIVAVARERHFGRAAEACFVSQPTLSVAIKKLEEELGTQIFERGSHEISVTPAGERIVAQAREAGESRSLGDVAVPGQCTRPSEDVIRKKACADVGPLPDPMVQRQHERQRLDEVRGEGGEQEVALTQGLPHKGDVALLQVAQSAVDQLARTAGRALGDVALVDQRHAHATTRRI